MGRPRLERGANGLKVFITVCPTDSKFFYPIELIATFSEVAFHALPKNSTNYIAFLGEIT